MRIGAISSMNNSQPLRFSGCCDKKPSFQQDQVKTNSTPDYKKMYEAKAAEYALLNKKYDIAANLIALYTNPALNKK